ncbi:hypothetical protein P7C73_g3400, partial [Tremellales sp. Uapishka_1]
MPKRSSSEVSFDESDDIKPTAFPSPPTSLSPSSSKKQKGTPRTIPPAKASPKTKKDAGPKAEKQAYNKWTEEEDKIFLDILFEDGKQMIWNSIKADGRLEYRGSAGVKAHFVAVMNKLKKSG